MTPEAVGCERRRDDWLARVRLLLRGSIVAEDLDDHPKIAFGGQVGDPEAAERAAENCFAPSLCFLS
jgi:hypothetical protein